MKHDHPTVTASLDLKREVPADRSKHCPLRADVKRVASLGCDLAVALRRLKRRLKTCQRSCPCNPAKPAATPTDPPGPLCDLLEDFNNQVQAAISTVLEEWDTGA